MKIRGLLLEVQGLEGVSDDFFSQQLFDRICVPTLPDGIIISEKNGEKYSFFPVHTIFKRGCEQIGREEFLSLCQSPLLRENGLWIRVTGEVELWGGATLGSCEITPSVLKAASKGEGRHKIEVFPRLICDVIEVMTEEEIWDCTNPE